MQASIPLPVIEVELMKRTPEPQLLSPADEAAEYFAMDHQTVNRQFVDDLVVSGAIGPRLIDLGCGPAGIAIELCHRYESIEVLAIDAEIEMLEIAKREIDIAGMLDQISLQHADACAMDDFEDGMADTVISNSLLHHLANPEPAMRTAIRLLGDSGRLFIRDLSRPASAEEVEHLVRLYAGQESENAQQLLRQSLHAAWTPEEIGEILDRLSGPGCSISAHCVQMTSDRHWTIDWTNEPPQP